VSFRFRADPPLKYERLIKPIFYGMGVAVTEKGIDLYANNRVFETSAKSYLSLGLADAAQEFEKDLIVHHYLKEGSAKAAARVLSLAKNEEIGRICLSQALKRNGLTFRDIRANPEKFSSVSRTSQFAISDAEVINALDTEIRCYSEIVRPILFQRLMTQNSSAMATRFSALAKDMVGGEFSTGLKMDFKDYEAMTLGEALESFKGNYLWKQFIESGYDGKLAAEKSGITYGNFKVHMHKRNICMTDLKRNRASS